MFMTQLYESICKWYLSIPILSACVLYQAAHTLLKAFSFSMHQKKGNSVSGIVSLCSKRRLPGCCEQAPCQVKYVKYVSLYQGLVAGAEPCLITMLRGNDHCVLNVINVTERFRYVHYIEHTMVIAVPCSFHSEEP